MTGIRRQEGTPASGRPADVADFSAYREARASRERLEARFAAALEAADAAEAVGRVTWEASCLAVKATLLRHFPDGIPVTCAGSLRMLVVLPGGAQ